MNKRNDQNREKNNLKILGAACLGIISLYFGWYLGRFQSLWIVTLAASSYLIGRWHGEKIKTANEKPSGEGSVTAGPEERSGPPDSLLNSLNPDIEVMKRQLEKEEHVPV